jgi:hypothetical protein
MRNTNTSQVIYGNSPFIEDMGVLTLLCLLHDEVFLFGSKPLDEQFKSYWKKNKFDEHSKIPSVIEQTFQVLEPEGVISFFSPESASARFPGADELELRGIEGIEERDGDSKKGLVLKVKPEEMNALSRFLIRGTKSGTRTVSDLLRDASLLTAAYKFHIPVLTDRSHISINGKDSNVHPVANYLAHKTLEKLVLPELRAYHAEDILEARVKLKSEFTSFKAAILDLVWLLHQQVDLNANLEVLPKECDLLIETKITSALMQLENSINAHQSSRVRRILRSTGGVMMELGKSLIAPDISSALLGGSSTLLKATDVIHQGQPSNHIASFIYKVKEKRF